MIVATLQRAFNTIDADGKNLKYLFIEGGQMISFYSLNFGNGGDCSDHVNLRDSDGAMFACIDMRSVVGISDFVSINAGPL